jgi:hypothetical protein
MTIHVVLLNEGTWCARPTECVNLGNGLFKLMATPNYDPEDERWEFPPGSIVRGRAFQASAGEILLAVNAQHGSSG